MTKENEVAGKIYGGGELRAARAVITALIHCQTYLDIHGDIAEIGLLEGEYLRRFCEHGRPGEGTVAIDP
jgi:hypothetical protein